MTAAFSDSLTVLAAPLSAASATVTLGGADYVFDSASGRDRGSYTDRAFIQRCIECTHPRLPAFRAYYRPDADCSREEWVFELGDTRRACVPVASVTAGNPTVVTTTAPHCLVDGTSADLAGLSYTYFDPASGTNKVASIGQRPVKITSPNSFTVAVDSRLGATKAATATVGVWDYLTYKATITRADGTTTAINVPAHYWFSRWRWQSAPRPVRRTVADLVAAKLIPSYVEAGLSQWAPTYTIPAYTPMALCGLTAQEGNTGERAEIGFLTDPQSQWLVRSCDEGMWRHQAEASGTLQWHLRDCATGNVIDPVALPDVTMYSPPPGGCTLIQRTRINLPDAGHFPSLCYLPFLLTGDPYYLEEVQMVAAYMPVANPPSMRCPTTGRYYAWPLRSCGQAVLATPDTVPSWLLPRARFEALLDKYRAAIEAKVTDTVDPWNCVFRTMMDAGQDTLLDPIPSGDHIWQHAFVSMVVAWLVAAGRDEWRQAATWSIQSEIDRCSVASGYQRSTPGPYHFRLRPASRIAQDLPPNATGLVLQYADTFAVGDQVTIGSETVTLLSRTDDLHWTVTRTKPTAWWKVGTSPSGSQPVFGSKFTSWAQAMVSNHLVYAGTTRWDTMPGDPTGMNLLTYDTAHGDAFTYVSYVRGALAQSLRAGLAAPGLQNAFVWLDSQIRGGARASACVATKWAIMP